MNLVVGATGVLGTEICRLFRQNGQEVRAFVRRASAAEKKETLEKMGAQLIEGDLKDPSSLERACKNISAVVSTATSIVSRQAGDSFIDSDQNGHLNLIQAALKQKVKQFVFISFPPIPLEFPLQTAKRAVEDGLQKSGLTYTILQPTFFQEVWLGPHLGFDANAGKARIYGSGENKISWISFKNVAEFAVKSLSDPEAANAVLPLGGPDNLSPVEVVRIFEELSGKSFQLEFVPEQILQTQYESATDPVQKTFAGLMLDCARGSIVDGRGAATRMSVHLQSVRDYARLLVG